MKSNVFFRADGNPKIGFDHIDRCLAIAEMLSDNFDCHFIIRDPSLELRESILEVCKSLIKLEETRDHLHEARMKILPILRGEEIVVLAGNHFELDYQKAIRQKGSTLICIDDAPTGHFVADVVINQSGSISPEAYSIEKYTRLCIGPSYALIRRPFWEAAQNRKSFVMPENCLVCLGGIDPYNDTMRVLKTLEGNRSLRKCYVITGDSYAFQPELKHYIDRSRKEIIPLSKLSAAALLEVMQKCGTAVCLADSISYQYLSVGGLLYLKQIANTENQNHRFLIEKHLAYPFHQYPLNGDHFLTESLESQSLHFKGDSPENILELFKRFKTSYQIVR